MYSEYQMRKAYAAQQAWYRYFITLISRCQQLRIPTNRLSEDNYLKLL